MSLLLLVLAAAMAADEPTEVSLAPGLSSASRKRRGHKHMAALPPEETIPESTPLADEGPTPVEDLAPASVEIPPQVAANAMAAAMGAPVDVQPAPTTTEELLGPIAIQADPSHDPWGNPWPRTADGIAAAIQALLSNLETCADSYAPIDLSADESEASVQLEFTVGLTGDLQDLVVSDGTTDAFTGCLSAHMARLQFAPGALPQAVRVPVYVKSTRTVEEQASVSQPGEKTKG